MKTEFSENFYKENKDRLFEKYKNMCDYEHDLKILLPDFSALPEEAREKALEVATKITAKKVVDTAKKDLIKQKHMIEDIKAGRTALGYISKRQEVDAWYNLRIGFEFSCYMLAQFKKKYEI